MVLWSFYWIYDKCKYTNKNGFCKILDYVFKLVTVKNKENRKRRITALTGW